MRRLAIALVALVCAVSAAHAFGFGNQFGKLGKIGTKGGSNPPATHFLLADTSSALLVNTGSKFLVQ